MTKMVAQNLEDIAGLFDVYASDQIAMKRRYSTARDKREADIRAEVWRSAASDIRNIVFASGYVPETETVSDAA